MRQVAAILLSWLLTLGTSWGLGRILLSRLALPLFYEEEQLFAWLAGSACLSTIVFALSAAHLAYKGSFIAVAALTALGCWRVRADRSAAPRLPSLPPFWKAAFLLVYVPFAVAYVVNALAPETSPDGVTYHLGLVARYFREHGIPAITTNMYASLSEGVEMLFLFAFAWGRHSAAALVHCSFLLAMPLLILQYGRRWGMPGVGVVGGLLVFVSPVAGVAGTSAYNDLAVAALVFALFALLQIWKREPRPGLLVLVGLMAGFAFGTKFTAGLAIPYAFGVVAWRQWRTKQSIPKPAATVLAFALLIGGPWLVKNWIVVHNPVAPFFNAWFPNPNVHLSMEESYLAGMRSYEMDHPWQAIPLEVTVQGGRLAGFLGPIFLLTPLILLALRDPLGRPLVLAAAIFFLPYPSNIGARFLLPSAVFVAPAVALALSYWRGMATLALAMQALCCWPGNQGAYCQSSAWRLNGIPWKAAFRAIPEEQYLAQHIRDYQLVQYVNAHGRPAGRIYSFGGFAEAYCKREVLTTYASGLAESLADDVYGAVLGDVQPTRLLTFTLPTGSYRRLRIAQTGGSSTDQPSMNEVRFRTVAGELPRSQAWRIRANPFPWDVQLAFDGNPVTRWKSWQSGVRSSFIEVDFGAAQPVTRVEVQRSEGDQRSVRLEIQTETAPNQWRTIAGQPQESAVAPTDLRQYAIQELKSHGIQFLVVGDSDLASQDMVHSPFLWGVHPVARVGDKRLYELD